MMKENSPLYNKVKVVASGMAAGAAAGIPLELAGTMGGSVATGALLGLFTSMGAEAVGTAIKTDVTVGDTTIQDVPVIESFDIRRDLKKQQLPVATTEPVAA